MPRPVPRPLLDELAVRANQRRAMLRVLAVPCKRHHASAGRPCWTIVTDTPQKSIGLCGERIEKAQGGKAAAKTSTTSTRRAAR